MTTSKDRPIGPIDERIVDAKQRVRDLEAELADAWRELQAAVGAVAADAAPAAGFGVQGVHSEQAGPELDAKIRDLEDRLGQALVDLNELERAQGEIELSEFRARGGVLS